MGIIFLEHIGGSRMFSYAGCDMILVNRNELIGTHFTRATAEEFLFNKVVNLTYKAEELMEKNEDETTAAPSIQNVADEELLEESGKLKLVVPLLQNLKSSGHRTLLYRILINRKWKVIRIDGTCPLSEREKRIEKFQTDSSYPVFLLTTQVGGVGFTLTAADSVIIYSIMGIIFLEHIGGSRMFSYAGCDMILVNRNELIGTHFTRATAEEFLFNKVVNLTYKAEELMEKNEDETTAAPSIQNVADEELLEESGKLKLVVPLLQNLKSSGHRTLLYRILINRKWKVICIDGTCPLSEREKRIEKFQTDSSYPVFLLTTQVGGVGLTLTAADSAIILL